MSASNIPPKCASRGKEAEPCSCPTTCVLQQGVHGMDAASGGAGEGAETNTACSHVQASPGAISRGKEDHVLLLGSDSLASLKLNSDPPGPAG